MYCVPYSVNEFQLSLLQHILAREGLDDVVISLLCPVLTTQENPVITAKPLLLFPTSKWNRKKNFLRHGDIFLTCNATVLCFLNISLVVEGSPI